jgi:hypothetical protein
VLAKYIAAVATIIIPRICGGQEFHPNIPRAWDDKEVARVELPLAQRDRSPKYLTEQEYYARTVRVIYRTYPIYAPGRAPAGYLDELKKKEPEVIVFDASTLRTKDDWIRAGEAVFNDSPSPVPTGPDGFRTPPGLSIAFSVTREGIRPAERYVIRKKGLVEQSTGATCAGCHTRVLPDGTALPGGQLDVAIYPAFANQLKRADSAPGAARGIRELDWITTGAPWIAPREEFDKLTNQELAARYDAMPAGVLERQGTSSASPVRVPSLIGIEDIKYLDASGLVITVRSATSCVTTS